MQEADTKDLTDRDDRALAKLACIARCDVYFGGCRAVTIARRLDAMGSQLPVHDVIIQAYHSHDGTARDFLPFACPECGTVHLGQDAAYSCCAFEK